MRILFALVLLSCLRAQTPPFTVQAPLRTLPAHVADKLSAEDRVLFGRLMRVGLEAAWSAVTQEGYPLCFINELTALNGDRRLVGRARTARYLPNRKDLRDKLYAAGPQLNYRTAEEAEPGDVLVFDAGGERRSTVSGAMVTTRFLVRGGTGILVDGCMRDVPDLAAMAPGGVSAMRARVERESADDERRLPGTGAHWGRDGDAGGHSDRGKAWSTGHTGLNCGTCARQGDGARRAGDVSAEVTPGWRTGLWGVSQLERSEPKEVCRVEEREEVGPDIPHLKTLLPVTRN